MTKQKSESLSKYSIIIALIVSTLALVGLIQTYLAWPQKVKDDIKSLYDQNIEVKKQLDTKAEKKEVEAGFALIRKDIQRLDEKQEESNSMIKFLYQKALETNK